MMKPCKSQQKYQQLLVCSSVQFFTLNLTYMHTYIYRKQCSGAEGALRWQFESCQARAVCTAAWMPAACTTVHLRHSFASGLLRSTRSRHRCDRRRNGAMAAGRLLPAEATARLCSRWVLHSFWYFVSALYTDVVGISPGQGYPRQIRRHLCRGKYEYDTPFAPARSHCA